MKFLPSQLIYLLQDRRARRNIRALAEFTLFLTVLVAVFSFLFHVIMAHEGRDFSAVTGVYWTLTVMSTLGFGDITFNSDLGRLFSIIVLVSGILFLLVMLPFTFIQFFYAPWLEAQNKSRVPRTLPPEVTRHVLITCWDPIAIALVGRLRQYGHAYVIIVPEVQQALDLVDQGFRVLVGELDDATTYERAHVDQAALVVALNDDMKNTSIVYTVREIAPQVPIVANADLEDSVDILRLAGCSHVFQFMNMLGHSLARRTLGAHTRSNVIGRFEDLVIAEAPAMRTPLVGKSIRHLGLRQALPRVSTSSACGTGAGSACPTRTPRSSRAPCSCSPARRPSWPRTATGSARPGTAVRHRCSSSAAAGWARPRRPPCASRGCLIASSRRTRG